MTQREISRRAGMSLGKVNFILKALISRGLVKVHNFKKSNHKKAYLYILTSLGIEEKSRIMYAFLAGKIKEYEMLGEQIRFLREEINLLESESITKAENSKNL